MKKILSVLLSAAMILAMLCCGAFAEAADVTGEWYGSLFGLAMTLTFNEDGTYVMDMDDEDPTDGTWKLDGDSMILDEGTDEEVVFAYDGESLYAEMEGLEFLFTREPVEVFEAAPARTDATLEEFAGTWNCTLVDMMGMQVPPEMAEMELTLTIDGANVCMIMGISGEPTDIDLTGEFADGALTVTVPSEYEDVGASDFTIQLLEDGTMSVTTLMMDEALAFSLVFYMSSEVAE